MTDKTVWFVTGAGRGMGVDLVKAALAAGHAVRHFFELPLLVDAPARWDRMVDEGNGRFTFSFFWVDRTTVPKNVYPGHDVFLEHALSQM